MNELMAEFMNIRRLTPGRVVFAMHQMEEIALQEQAPPVLVDEYKRAAAAGEETLHKELLWNNSRGPLSTARGNAMLLDSKIDQELGAVYGVLESQAVGPDSDPLVKAAKTIKKAFFNEGLKSVTQIEYEVQLGVVTTMLSRIDAEYTNEFALLGLSARLERIREYCEQFRLELRKRDTRTISFNEVEAARSRHHIALCRAVAVTLAELKEETPENSELLHKLLAPLIDQQERVRAAFQRNRRPLDVDPDSGEEVVRSEDDGAAGGADDVVADNKVDENVELADI